ncbi:ABC transporter ATP-binding protein [Rossellomorea vietnamensis]|uniref:ABC transporter ATP-binding protein n=1 Tax=Rossellomorea vietnamensis TaxID=218284 RepID=A0A5D4M0S2_9BACI|nr:MULTISPECIES: ABC transporter ATP-binding protein [Bacillaceae]TYR95534.1 ABC transporter ATP-binding protein [Rossellomorea vietnamensis]
MNGQPELLKVEQLSFRYEDDEAWIFKDVSFSLFEKETLLLLGPSGCGKSTLCYCVEGLYPEAVEGVMEGEIFFQKKKLTDFPPGKINQRMGIVFQDPESQFCMLTVEDELAFVLENHNVPPEEMSARIDEALEKTGLLSCKESLIHVLSGGQKQKLALAGVLLTEPDLVILDEPTANLDPVSSSELVELLKNLQESQGFSMIVIEHRLDDWMDITDRCLVFSRNGEIIFNGNPRECFTEHASYLNEEGVWLPSPTLAGMEAAAAGIYAGSSLPFTTDELIEGVTETFAFLQKFQPVNSDSLVGRKPLLEMEQVTFSYRQKEILRNIDFNVYEGEFVALLGANGSGKSTLSKVMCGIHPPSAGSIFYEEKALGKWKETELWKRIGYVFQNPEHQFITDSVFEELSFGLSQHGYSESEISAKVRNTLERLNLLSAADRHPFSLSQGQKRRLSVATMLSDQNGLLILDEPTFGQDARTSRELMDLLVERRKNGGAIVMITHDMELVHKYTDRVVVLSEGRILFNGSPSLLWEQDEILLQARLKLPFAVKLQRQIETGAENRVIAQP